MPNDPFFAALTAIFTAVIEYAILLIELVGVCVLIYTVARAVVAIFRRGDRVRLDLAEGIALSLEFKMGAELLRTLIVRDWNEILVLGAVILLRAALTFLIQWEIRIERQIDREKHAEEKEKK